MLLAGCAGTKKISRDEVMNRIETIKQLGQNLQKARGQEVDLYAPQNFKKADNLLEEAVKTARRGKSHKAINTAEEGLQALRKAETDAEQAKKQMWEISDYRQKAIEAGAPDLYKDEFSEAEAFFRETTALLENGNIQKSKSNHPALIQSYTQLEKQALEKGIIELAKVAFKQAKDTEAEEYAPQYYNRAQKELNLALSILEADRTRIEKANHHARLASNIAKKASQIAELVKLYERRDYTHEDIVLWYWDQLEKINAPLEQPLDFEQPNHIVIQNFAQQIRTIKANLKTAQNDIKKLSIETREMAAKQQEYVEAMKKDHQAEIDRLNAEMDKVLKECKAEISEQKRIQAEQQRKERQAKQRFSYVQSLFDESEAQVFRRGNDILIAAQGFYFPTGVYEILSTNFGLLNKILNSINQFPDARIEVAGHTDSVGSSEFNMNLSKNRAKSVARFLTNVGGIDPARITATGFGDSKPVASNNTKEGRIKNRRIEVTIVNE